MKVILLSLCTKNVWYVLFTFYVSVCHSIGQSVTGIAVNKIIIIVSISRLSFFFLSARFFSVCVFLYNIFHFVCCYVCIFLYLSSTSRRWTVCPCLICAQDVSLHKLIYFPMAFILILKSQCWRSVSRFRLLQKREIVSI